MNKKKVMLGAKKNIAIRMNELTRKKIYETNSMVIEHEYYMHVSVLHCY